MMKIITSILVMLFYYSSIWCQDQKLELFPKIGVSLNSVYDPNNWETQFSPYLVGIELKKPIANRLSISTDISYIRKGPHYRGDNKFTISEDYIFDFILVSGNINFLYLEKLKLESILGIYTGLLFNSKIKYLNIVEDYYVGNKNIDLGLNISLRKYISLGTIELFIEPKFQLGLITVSNTKQISYQLISGIRL